VKNPRTYAVISVGVGSVALLLACTRILGPNAQSTDFGRFLFSVGFLAIIGGLVMMIGRTLRLPITLCLAQTTVTAILTFWADKMSWMYAFCPNCRIPRFARLHLAIVLIRQTWSSINAPTFPLNYSDLHSVPGMGAGEILYYIAVAVLWYLVGYFHEQRKLRSRVVSVAILIWGLILLCLCVAIMPDKDGRFSWFGFLNASPYAVWGVILIRFGVRNLRVFSQTRQSIHS
jgi:hypothetical protein